MLPIDTASAQRRRDEPARFCFRYRRHRRNAGAYDVFIELNERKNDCRIEIHHANFVEEERRPFTSGPLNVRRLRDAVDLLGLVDRIVVKDRSRPSPGSLVFAARLKSPYVLAPSVAIRLHAGDGKSERKMKRDSGGRSASVSPPHTGDATRNRTAPHTTLRARARHRYPQHRI